MLELNLPTYKYRLENKNGNLFIFDPIRKKLVMLTPEEWVRQHLLNLVNYQLGYPASRTRVESGLKYNSLSKRTDILIYDQDLKPLVLVECKAPHVKLKMDVANQIATYNQTCKAPLIIISNGLKTYAGFCVGTEVRMLDNIPSYKELKEF